MNTHTVVVGQDGELDGIGLGIRLGVLLGSSGRRPVVEADDPRRTPIRTPRPTASSSPS